MQEIGRVGKEGREKIPKRSPSARRERDAVTCTRAEGSSNPKTKIGKLSEKVSAVAAGGGRMREWWWTERRRQRAEKAESERANECSAVRWRCAKMKRKNKNSGREQEARNRSEAARNVRNGSGCEHGREGRGQREGGG